MTNNNYIIKNVLEKIVSPMKGLTLLTNPAGSGKSYETSLFIADLMNKTDRQIYYITPRLDNVDELYDDLLMAIGTDDKKADRVLKIPSYRNAVMNGLKYFDDETISSWSETKTFIKQIKQYEAIQNSGHKKLIENILFYEKNNPERKFRKKLAREFKKSYKKQNNKYKNAYEYMKDSKWSIIEKIYPSAAIDQKQVFILSSTKFFGRNDPIIKPAYKFIDDKIIKDAIVIIDEFDAIKRDLLESVATDNLHTNVIRLFKDIYYRLQDIEAIDENMLQIGKGNCKKQLEKLKTESEELKVKYFPKTKNMKLLVRDPNDNILKRLENTDRILSYKGVHACPAIGDGQTYFYLPCNEKNLYHEERETDETCNLILQSKEIDFERDDAYPVWFFINEIKNFVAKALKNVYFIALDYQQERNALYMSNGSNEENLVSLYNAISTVLSNLNFSDSEADLTRYTNYVLSVTEPGKYQYFHKKDNRNHDRSIYSKGLYYSCDYESERTRDNSQIHNYQLYTTPELIMLDLCTNAHVIGISATAEVPSINNFNLVYLAEQLKQRNADLYELTCEESNQLMNDYQRKTEGYQKYQLETKIIPIALDNGRQYDVARDLAYLQDENQIDDIKCVIEYDMKEVNSYRVNLQANIENNTSSTEYETLVKIWKYVKDVMKLHQEEQVISNGLIFSNKGLKLGEKEIYTLENIKLGATFAYMGIKSISYQAARSAVDDMFVYVNADKLKKYKETELKDMVCQRELQHIEQSFQENKLIFMITTYNSVSRGNNPQVKVGKQECLKRLEKGELYEINDIFKKYDYMDWDSIYLEKPSYIIPNINDFSSNSDFSEELQSLFIVEDICQQDGVALTVKNRILKDLFMSFLKQSRTNAYNLLYGYESVKNAYTVAIYQTIGRISRTNLKKKYNAIYYDTEIIAVVETDIGKTKLGNTTHEFETFRQALKKEQYMKEHDYQRNIYNTFNKQNQRCQRAIEAILDEAAKEGWNSDKIEFWELLREVLLRVPTGMTKAQITKWRTKFDRFDCVQRFHFDFKDVFFEFKQEKNHYFFNSEGENIYVSKDNQKNSRQTSDYPYEVSIADSRLIYFKRDADITDYFTEKGYRIDWHKKSKYVMCPYIYQAIYKGAIGEEILKAVFEKKCGYKIIDIKDSRAYEKFDFLIKAGESLFYVDSKNFSEVSLSKEFANERLLAKLKRKIEYLDIKKCFVINIIDEIGDKNIVERANFVTVPGMYTFINNTRATLKMSTETEKYTVLKEIQDMILKIEGEE